MATRFYLETDATAAPPQYGRGSLVNPTITPAFDAAWDITTGVTRGWMTTQKLLTGNTQFALSEATATTPIDVLARQFISGTLSAQTISGTVKGQVVALEENADMDARAQVVIRVVSGDGTTVLATLLAADTSALSSEFASGFTNRKFPLAAISPATLSSYACSDGDRIVVEIGLRAHNSTASQRNAFMRFRTDGASDLPEDESTASQSFNSWIEFSDDITFYQDELKVSQSILLVAGTRDVARHATSQSILLVAGKLDYGWWDIGMVDEYGGQDLIGDGPMGVGGGDSGEGTTPPVPTPGNAVSETAAYDDWDTLIGGRTTKAWYKLQDTSGTTAVDDGDGSVDGTYAGSPPLEQEGLLTLRDDDLAVLFEGSPDEVSVPNTVFEIPTATSAFSMEIVFKTTQTGTTGIMGGRDDTNDNPINALYMVNGNLRWDTRDSAGAGLNQLSSSGALVNDGQWHHVACTRTTGKAKTIYIDGVSRGTGSDSMGTGTGVMDYSYIARERRNSYYFQGTISEVVTYDSTLSSGDVTDSHEAAFFPGVELWRTASFTPTVGNMLLVAFLSKSSAPALTPVDVTHPGVPAGLTLTAAVPFDPMDEATTTRFLSVWHGLVTSATAGKATAFFDSTQTEVIGKVLQVSGVEPEILVRDVATNASDATVNSLIADLGEAGLTSKFYTVGAWESTADADETASTGTLLSQTDGADQTLAIFNAGNDAINPTLAWEGSPVRGAVIGLEIFPKKEPPPTNIAPTASFSRTPSSGSPPLNVDVDATASSDSDGFISRYIVAWGDGAVTNGTDPTVSHTYTAAGTYQIRVSVIDDDGALTTSTPQSVTVTGTPGTLAPLITGIMARENWSAQVGKHGYNPNVKWSDLEPTEGNYNWTIINNLLANEGTKPFRVRLFAGKYAPDYVKSGAGDVYVFDPVDGKEGYVPKWWTTSFRNDWEAFIDAFAAEFPTEIKFIFSTACMTIYGEPCLRGMRSDVTRNNLRAAGLDVGGANDIAAQKYTTEYLAEAFPETRIGMAFNPFQILTAGSFTTSVTITKELMSYFRGLYGERFVLQNNSLRETSQGTQYEEMYAHMRTLGPPISFQTATRTKVGNLTNVIQNKAVPYGAHAVEAPYGYTPTYTSAQQDTWEAMLDDNL